MKFERLVIRIEKYVDAHGVPQYVTATSHPADIGTALSVLCDAITAGRVATFPPDIVEPARALGNVLARYHTGGPRS